MTLRTFVIIALVVAFGLFLAILAADVVTSIAPLVQPPTLPTP